MPVTAVRYYISLFESHTTAYRDDERTLASCPVSPEHLFYKVYISLAMLFYVNNKQNLFNLNENDGNCTSIFNFQVTLNAHMRHGNGIILVQCPVEAITLEH
jgi:hypothetical protein